MSIENSDKALPILRAMKWIEIIDSAFHYCRRYFRLFIGIALIYFAVDYLHDRLIRFFFENYAYRLVEVPFNYLFSEFANGVLAIATCKIYFQRHITIRDTLRRFVSIYPRYIVSLLIYLIPLSLPSLIQYLLTAAILHLSTLITICLFLLTIAVSIYFQITWLLYVPVIVVEGSMKPKPLRRSRALLRKSWWRVFGTIIAFRILLRIITVIFVVSFVIVFSLLGLMGDSPVFDIVEYVLRSTVGFYSDEPPPFDSESTANAILRALYTVIGVLTEPLYAITITLIYFNQRVRREGFDIELMSSWDEVQHL